MLPYTTLWYKLEILKMWASFMELGMPTKIYVNFFWLSTTTCNYMLYDLDLKEKKSPTNVPLGFWICICVMSITPWRPQNPLKLGITSTISSFHATSLDFWTLYSLHKQILETPNEQWICQRQIIHCTKIIMLHVQACKANMWHKSLQVLYTCNACLFFPWDVLISWLSEKQNPC